MSTTATAITNAAASAVNNKSSSSTAELRLNNTATTPAAATTTPCSNNNGKDVKIDDPLPSDLKRILGEVAKNGECSWLPWSTEHHYNHSFHNKNSYRFHNKRSPPRCRRKNGISNKRKRTSAKMPSISLMPSSGTTAASSSSSSLVARSLALSGSEFEDSNTSQYECDSEGTSSTKTTNSEISEGQHHFRKKFGSTLPQNSTSRTRYETLANAISSGISIVLDHSFRYYGGYKPTLAEVCQYRNCMTRKTATAENKNNYTSNGGNSTSINSTITNGGNAATYIFQQRRQRLINSVLRRIDGPPFTIQRLAEVLVSPYRFYKQTHKLCNCLEKLLLVTSSIHSFGGSTGGTTSQSRREERELAALADERDRQEKSEQRNRRHRCRIKSESVSFSSGGKDIPESALISNKWQEEIIEKEVKSPSPAPDDVSLIQAQAKAALRHKFEHAVTKSDSGVVTGGNNATNTKLPIRTSSPPPPSLPHSATHETPPFVTHSGSDSGSNQQLESTIGEVARGPSQILFSSEATRLNNSGRDVHLLQLNHAAAMAGVMGPGDSPSPSSSKSGTAPLDIVSIQKKSSPSPSRSNFGPSGSLAGLPLGGASKDALGAGREINSFSKYTSDADTEVEPGRSYASNSDIDSESGDDVSLDDSASDRSDGSDPGFGSLGAAPNISSSYNNYSNEPFSAARLMALNRKHQQKRLQQSRVQMLIGEAAHLKNNPLFHNNNAGAIDSTEYQSGDSIDSTMAEDSGGSDSSSSDLAD